MEEYIILLYIQCMYIMYIEYEMVATSNAVVPHMVAKIAICDYPMASGNCLVALIAKLAKMGGV